MRTIAATLFGSLEIVMGRLVPMAGRGLAVATIAAVTLAVAAPAGALVWPDVAERVERDLAAPDPATRRAAAIELRSLGSARGAALAVTALSDPDDEVRLAAADAAIHLRAAGATEAVAGWMNAPDVRVRRKACEVARALPSPRAVAPLARTLGDPDAEVRAEAAEALGRQTSPEAVAPLLGRLDDPTPAVRIQIIAALARLGDARAVVPLVGKVEDSSPEVRQAVVRALGDLADARAAAALVLALRDQNPEVRRDALTALGRMRAADTIDAITPFVGDASPALRLAALIALGRIATPDGVRVLVASLGAHDDDAGALEATPARDALVASGAAAVPSLHALLAGSPSPQAATSAAWVLGALHAREEAPAIILAMRRGVLPTAAALHAIAGAGTGADVPVVLEFVADRSPLVRGEALSAALALLDPSLPDGRAVEPLAAALRDARPTPEERARIATLLGRTGAPRAAPLLVELTRAQDLALRIAAIDALGALGPSPATAAPSKQDATSALLDALQARDAAVRLHAATALADAGGERARDALVAKLDGGDEIDRAAVLTALGGVLARIPNDASIVKLGAALALSAGPERDAIIETLGRAALPSATALLAGLARSAEPADRRAAATVSAARSGDTGLLRTLLADPDASVRAQAAWSLGALGDASDVSRLDAIARAADIDAATNAAAAIGKIAARAKRSELAAPLCALAADPRAFVRTNALAGLARAGGCGNGSPERDALEGDPSEDVRAAAALALAQHPSAASSQALERCARTDPSSAVSAKCRAVVAGVTLPVRTHAALVYVVPDGSDAPRPSTSYAMLFADGTLRAGTTDRRGAVFEPLAPEGEVSLRRPGR